MTYNSKHDEHCPHSKDKHGHCPHWWDGYDPCCWCSAPGLSREEMIENGMPLPEELEEAN